MNPLESLRGVLIQFSTAPGWSQLLAKATLLLAVAWVVHFSLARANPRWRILLWRGVASGLVLMAVWIPGPGLEIRIPTPEPAATALAPLLQLPVADREPTNCVAAFEQQVQGPVSIERTAATRDTPVAALHEATRPTVSAGPSLSWHMALLGVWGFGVALLLTRLTAALVRVTRLLRTLWAAPEEIVAEVGRIAGALGCHRQIQVRTSQRYAVPFQYGLRRPVLVLPERMCQPAYRGQLPGVVAHELSHVGSWDFGWNAALQTVSTLLWFHPLSWRIGSVHRAACDAVCDTVAASYLGDVHAYCRTLAQVALESAGSFPSLGLAMARTCDVRRRIARLQQRVFAAALSRRAIVGVALVGLSCVTLLAGVRLAPAESRSQPAIAQATTPPNVDLYGDPLPPGTIARLGTVRYRLDHYEYLQRATFVSDSNSLVTIASNEDGSFCWWDATSGKLLRMLRSGGGIVFEKCAITPDGKVAVAIEHDRRVKSYSPRFRLVWREVATGKELAAIALASSVSTRLAITPDGAMAATGSDGAVRIWDMAAKEQTADCTTLGSIVDVAFSPNGKMVSIVTQEDGVLLWDLVPTRMPKVALTRSKDFRPWKVAYSMDGKTLAVGGLERNAVLLDASTGRLLRTLDWPHPYPAMLVFSSDGKQLALAGAGGDSNNVAVWDLTSGKLRYTFTRSSDWGVWGMAFSHDGRLLAVGTIVLQVWDLATGKCVSADFVGHEPYVGNAIFLGQSDMVATTGGEGAVRLWEARTGRQKMLIRHDGLVFGLAVSPDGKLLASSAQGKANSVRIWDGSTGKLLHELAGHAKMGAVLRLGFSADGKRLAGTGDDGKVRVWNVEDGTLLNESDLQLGFSGTNSEVHRMMFNSVLRAAVFSPDIRFLVADFGRHASILSVDTGKVLQKFESGGLQQPELAMSPDGKLLLSNKRADSDASNSDLSPLNPTTHELRLRDLANGKEIWRQDLPGVDGGPVCISADGKRFAVSVRGDLPEIRVCDLATRKVLQALKNVGHARCLSFSPDGCLLVAGMEDGAAITWDLSELSSTVQPRFAP